MPDLTEQECKKIVFECLMFQSKRRELGGVNIRVSFLDGGPDRDDLLMFQVDDNEPLAMPVLELYRMLLKAQHTDE